MLTLSELDFCVVDTETTGGKADDSKIIDIAVFHVRDGIILGKYQTLINPGVPIPPWISALTGINDSMVKDAPRFEEISTDLMAFLKRGVFVAHNVNFDFSFVKKEFERVGHLYASDHLCTLRMARRLYPELPSRSLGPLCEHLMIDIYDRHRAAGDAEATVYLLKHILKTIEKDHSVKTWSDLEKWLGPLKRRIRSMKKVSLLLLSLTLSVAAQAYDKNFIAQHLRKSLNLDTRTEITVSSSALPSNFGSLKVVPITINGGPYQVYLSADEKQYIWGYPVDLTVDPDEMRARNLNLNNVRSKGSVTAPVTIVEFTDMQCPFCKNVHDILDKELYAAYTPNDVRLVFKHFPLSNHAWAENAAVATECAGEQKPDAFWKVSDAIFENSVSLSTANFVAKANDYVKAAGVDMAKFKQCYDMQKPLAKVQYDRREGTMAGVNSTPTLFVNGRMLRGIRTFEDLKVVIEEKRKEAAKKK